MKDMLIYFLTFVHPKTEKVLLGPSGKNSIQFRTQNIPRVGDFISLDFELNIKSRKRNVYKQSFCHTFQVTRVNRRVYAHTPQFESGNPAYFEESTSFYVTVVPTTKKFLGTIRLIKRFYGETLKKYNKWRKK